MRDDLDPSTADPEASAERAPATAARRRAERAMKNIDRLQERNRTARWATRLDANYTRSLGCDELHGVFFTPSEDFGGSRGVVVVQIPETPDELFVAAMKVATQSRARVVFFCDTLAQARKVARKAAKMLPNHCRVSMERAQAGAWGALQ
jgi:hypothetical protein